MFRTVSCDFVGFQETGQSTTIDPSQVPLEVSAIHLGAGVGAWVPGGQYQPQQAQPNYMQVLSLFHLHRVPSYYVTSSYLFLSHTHEHTPLSHNVIF